MKRTGFKKPSYEEAMLKLRAKQSVSKVRLRKPKPLAGTKAYDEAKVLTLKTKLWAIFSKYIRIKRANMAGMVMTCDGVYLHWKETHCGHLFVNSERNQSLGGNELWYYENNFAAQSANGNYFNANNSSAKYTLYVVNQFGAEEVEKMIKLKQKPRKFTAQELEEKYKYYKEQFAILNT